MLILKSRRRGVGLLAFGPDSRTLAARSETGLQLWSDIHSGARARVFPEVDRIGHFQFGSEGESIFFSGLSEGLLDLTTGQIRRFNRPDIERTSTLTADGLRWVSVLPPLTSARFASLSVSDPGLECFPTARPFSGRPLWRSPLTKGCGYTGRPLALRDGRIALAEGRPSPGSFRIIIRSGESGAILALSADSSESNWPERSATSPDGKWLIGQRTNKLHIWSLEDLAAPPIERVNPGSKKIFTDIAFHPSGRFLGVTSTDETVKLYDTGTWQVSRTFSWGLGKMVGIAFSPDGVLAAAGSDRGRIVIWDVDD